MTKYEMGLALVNAHDLLEKIACEMPLSLTGNARKELNDAVEAAQNAINRCHHELARCMDK